MLTSLNNPTKVMYFSIFEIYSWLGKEWYYLIKERLDLSPPSGNLICFTCWSDTILLFIFLHFFTFLIPNIFCFVFYPFFIFVPTLLKLAKDISNYRTLCENINFFSIAGHCIASDWLIKWLFIIMRRHCYLRPRQFQIPLFC